MRVALACAVAAASVGCGGSKVESVLVVGDSVTVLSAPQITDRIEGARVVARSGYTTREITPLVRDAGSADASVVLIGYNDLRRGIDTAALDELAATLSGCVVWFALPPVPLYGPQTAAFNAAASELEGDISVSTAWRDAVSTDDTLVSERDGVHPTEAGRAAYAEIVEHELERLC